MEPTIDELHEAIHGQLSSMASLLAEAEGRIGHRSPYRFMLEEGLAMGPNVERPAEMPLGEPRACYANVYRMLDGDRTLKEAGWAYCEGWAASTCLGFPIEHAWLGHPDGSCIDLTWAHPPGTIAFFGIPFRFDYVRATILRTETFGVMHDDDIQFNRKLICHDARRTFRLPWGATE